MFCIFLDISTYFGGTCVKGQQIWFFSTKNEHFFIVLPWIVSFTGHYCISKTVIPFCTSASSGIGDSGKLLEEEAGTGNWLDGMRFRSSASEDDVKSWVDGLEK